MTINAPTLSSAIDKAVALGDTVTLNLTPPAAGDYDHTQILYRLPSASTWTEGPTYTGAQGTAGTVDVTSLTAGLRYEFLTYAVDAGGVIGPPSTPARAVPTKSGRTIQQRIIDNLVAALAAITQAGGAFADAAQVIVCRYRPDTDAWSGFNILAAPQEATKDANVVRGGGAVIEDVTLPVVVAGLYYETRDTTDADWEANAIHGMLAAISAAVLDDRTRGGLAINTTEPRAIEIPSDADLRTLAPATCEIHFEIRFRHYAGNHYGQP